MSTFGIEILGRHVAGDRLTRFIGRVELTANGSLDIGTGGTPFAYLEFGAISGPRRAPTITINGSVISWTVPDAPASMVYGVY